MKPITHYIMLDCQKTGVQATINIRKKDTQTNKIIASIFEKDATYFIDKNSTAVFRMTKNGQVLFNNCNIIDNKIEYVTTNQTTNTVGNYICEFVLYGENNQILTTPQFALNVLETIDIDGEVEACDEFSALSTKISETQNLIDLVENQLENGNFKGEKGDKGDPGKDGLDGKDGEDSNIKSISINGTNVPPDNNGNVDIAASGGAGNNITFYDLNIPKLTQLGLTTGKFADYAGQLELKIEIGTYNPTTKEITMNENLDLPPMALEYSELYMRDTPYFIGYGINSSLCGFSDELENFYDSNFFVANLGTPISPFFEIDGSTGDNKILIRVTTYVPDINQRKEILDMMNSGAFPKITIALIKKLNGIKEI